MMLFCKNLGNKKNIIQNQTYLFTVTIYILHYIHTKKLNNYPIGLIAPRNERYPAMMSLGRFLMVENSSAIA